MKAETSVRLNCVPSSTLCSCRVIGNAQSSDSRISGTGEDICPRGRLGGTNRKRAGEKGMKNLANFTDLDSISCPSKLQWKIRKAMVACLYSGYPRSSIMCMCLCFYF